MLFIAPLPDLEKEEAAGRPSSAMLCASQSRRMSIDSGRDAKSRRQSFEYMDTAGSKVDLNHLLANTFSIAASCERAAAERAPPRAAAAAAAKAPDKKERRLLPKLGSLKRRRRSTALCLMEEAEARKEGRQ